MIETAPQPVSEPALKPGVSCEWAVPLLLFALCLAAYGIGIRQLGFYWDDWPGMWSAQFLSPAEFRAYIAWDRPVSGWLFAWTAPLLGGSALAAHLFAFGLRWAIAVAIWWVVRGLWPARRWEAAAVAMLATVYPGFSLQSISWITSQGIYVPFLICLFSLGAMLWSVRSPAWRALALPAWLGSVLHLLFMEYFFGLELLRPLLLWTALRGDPQRRRRFLRNYLPYAAGTAAVLFWRIFLFRSSRPETDQVAMLNAVSGSPIKEIVQRVQCVLNDTIVNTVMAWTHASGPYLLKSEAGFVWLIGLGVLAATSLLCLAWLLYRYEPPHPEWSTVALVVAMPAVLLAGLPAWAVSREVVLGELSDRYALAPMFGSCLLAVALARRALRTRLQQAAVLALLAGIGAAYQYRTSERFARDWKAQRDLIWQLSWRIPHLAPGTSIRLLDESIVSPKSDYASSIPVNLLYAPGHHSSRLPYWVFHEEPEPAAHARTLTFRATPNAVVELHVPANGCLRVTADPGSRILGSPAAAPPAAIFGTEPVHGWCYYYEKAELARQNGDWNVVANLGDEARTRRLRPSDPAESQVFAEAYRRGAR
jgi:hypothetical protein